MISSVFLHDEVVEGSGEQRDTCFDYYMKMIPSELPSWWIVHYLSSSILHTSISLSMQFMQDIYIYALD